MKATAPDSSAVTRDVRSLPGWRVAGGVFAFITLALGAIGLAGWLFNEPQWRSLWKTGSEMKFNTALCLTLLGGSLLVSFSPGTLARKISLCGAAVVLLIAALTLSESLFSYQMGIDELVYKDSNFLGTTSPGRMAPQSATTLILLTLGIFFLRSESSRMHRLSQWVALVCLIFPAQALMGYVMGRMTIVGLGPQSSYMAIPTATAFICAALALLLREPDRYLMQSLTAQTHASGVFRRLLVSALFLPLILGWLALNVAGGSAQSPEYSVATVALVTTFIFVALTWFNAARLNAVTQVLAERERALHDTQARLEATLAATEVATWTWDVPNDRVYADKKLARFFCVSEADANGGSIQKYFSAIHPEDRAGVQAVITKALESQSGQYEVDYRLVQPDNSIRWVTARGKVERDEAGKPLRFPGVIIDISARKLTDAMLRQNEGLFSALVEQAPTGMYVVDSQFRLQQVNARALPAFAQVDARKGRDFAEVMHILWGVEVGDELIKFFRHTLSTGEPYISPRFSEYRHDLGVEESYEWETQRVTLPDGQHGVACYFQNVTERNRAEASLREAKTAAEDANRAKDVFLAALSHELRTPLNPALLIASESADNRQLPEEVRQNFETILKSIELEARLIDDLLDLTRITSGKLSLTNAPVDVHAVLTDALATIQSEQHGKKIQLSLKLAAEKFWVQGDAVRLQQVFWNVLKNAVKFTPPGGRIALETCLADAGQLSIKISDTGLGMNPEELGRAFSAFAQGDHAGGGGSHRFGGLGLGLAITKNLVELHSGSIRATSGGRDCGATFIIELPLAQKESENPPPLEKVPNLTPVITSGVRILLVEDHEPTRDALVHLLVRRHYEVKAAASIAEARTLAEKQKFHLLITDIGLPDGNGFELIQELRVSNPELRGIALTGYGMEEDIARSQNAGFVSHLVKPVRVQSLEAALEAALAVNFQG